MSRYNSEKKKERREKGLCTICGKPVDDQNYVMCSKCRKEQRDDWRYYQSMGVCPKCRKNPLIGDEKMCLECRSKKIEYNKAHGIKRTKEDRRMYDLNLKAKRISLGLCPRCGKREPAEGRTKCSYCLRKDTLRHRKGTDIRREREERGLCRWCGKEVLPHKKYCKDCYEKLCNQLEDARNKRTNDVFRKLNRIHFERREHEPRIKATS